jgi:hypothetical protein
LLEHYLHSAHAAHLQVQPRLVPPDPAPARPGVTPEAPSGHDQAMAWFATERHVLLAAASAECEDGPRPYAWQIGLRLQVFYQRRGYCRTGRK